MATEMTDDRSDAVALHKWPVKCSVHTITGEAPCLRLAFWEWRPDPEKPEIVYLCNYHHEPFWTPPLGGTT